MAESLSFQPIKGFQPVLAWVELTQLNIDPQYQRSLEVKNARALINYIAKHWDWGLFQPLSVSRRPDETLWIMDGQHRLEAARLRGDIPRLPSIITEQTDLAAEASTFVNLNRRRRALGSVDVFKASLVAGNEDSIAVFELLQEVGLKLAPHSNYISWTPGMVYCIPGILSAYKRHGRAVTLTALSACTVAFEGQILRYAGQILRGLFVFYATEGAKTGFDNARFVRRLSLNNQQQWMRKAAEQSAATGEGVARALAKVMLDAYRSYEA